MNTVLYVLLGIVMFGFIILIHELGHFLTARAFGVGIEEFAIGMGPKIFSHKGKDDIVYSIRAIPIGGFVAMIGENEEVDDEKALCKKPVWQRIIIVSAGAVMNIILGFVLMGVTVMLTENIYSTTIEGFNVSRDGVVSMESELFGLKAGDRIVKVENKNINVRTDFTYEVMLYGENPLDVTVIRDGEKTVIENIEFPTMTDSGITVGNSLFIQTTVLDKSFFEVARQAVYQSFSTLRMMWLTLVNTLKGKYGTEALSGPVGIVGQVEETAKSGADAFMMLVTMITLNLGIMNLLPLPALDGGRLFFMLIELVRGKPINQKYEGYVHAVGIVLLMALMVFVTYNDIARLFIKG